MESYRKLKGSNFSTLVKPPGTPMHYALAMLKEKYQNASLVEMKSVLHVEKIIEERLEKSEYWNPRNGLVIFHGETVEQDIKFLAIYGEEWILEPFKKIRGSLCVLDTHFHFELLDALFKSEATYGFVILTKSGAVFATVCYNERKIVGKLEGGVPTTARMIEGGIEALLAQREVYIRRVATMANQLFMSGDEVNMAGLTVAGNFEFHTDLSRSEWLDRRLRAIIVKEVVVHHGGENGLNEAIQLSANMLEGLRYMEEKKLIRDIFELISEEGCEQSHTHYVFGKEQTMWALENLKVRKFVIWEGLKLRRVTSVNIISEFRLIQVLTPTEVNDWISNQLEYDVVENICLLEWLVQEHFKFFETLELVSCSHQEGKQLVCSCGGMAAILNVAVAKVVIPTRG